MARYYTTGQAAKKLRVSVSTLKRWLASPEVNIVDRRNQNGWRLFSEEDLRDLREYKRGIRRHGKKFNDATLIPIAITKSGGQSFGQFEISAG